jgi:hypothetical protein
MRVYERDITLPLAIYFFLYYGARIRNNFVVFCNVMQTFFILQLLTRSMVSCSMSMTSQYLELIVTAALPNFFRGGDIVPDAS